MMSHNTRGYFQLGLFHSLLHHHDENHWEAREGKGGDSPLAEGVSCAGWGHRGGVKAGRLA